jgi:predicted transcriptional regulator
MRDDDEHDVAPKGDSMRMTTDIVASFVANNKISPEELTDLIRSVHRTLSGLSNGAEEKLQERPKPAAPINKSVSTITSSVWKTAKS